MRTGAHASRFSFVFTLINVALSLPVLIIIHMYASSDSIELCPDGDAIRITLEDDECHLFSQAN